MSKLLNRSLTKHSLTGNMEEHGIAYYLEDLNRVHDLSMEQLGEWKEKYPYSQMVHFLMAKKHQLEGFVEDMSVFHKASFYSVDRAFLQNRMTNSEAEVDEPEIDASTMQGKEELFEAIFEEVEGDVAEGNEAKEIDGIGKTEDLQLEMPPTSEEGSSIEDEDLSPFARWINGFEQKKIENANKSKKKKKSKKSKLAKQIEESVVKQDDIVSEPLANILAAQGHQEEAVAMYEKLSLIFPEKSSFFALQIEKINNSK